MSEDIAKLKEAIIEGDAEKVTQYAEAALEAGVSPLVALEKGVSEGAKHVGEQFERMEIFLTNLMLSGEAMMAALDVILPKMPKEEVPVAGRVVVGTVRGDIHEIGKNILKAMLVANGFAVTDLGCDVATSRFVEEAEKIDADIIAISALMTSTLGGQKDVIDYLQETGKRDRFIVMVGGGPTNQEWADEIGADGFAETAPEAVREAIRLIEERKG
ncbi:MAG: corrinoid protein [Candidatus Thorarchaeota archaeon]|nr:MAG: corrinoid protein [Candidatus Thorarchaeota archaeon]